MPSTPKPWPPIPVTPENFLRPPREYGILPFWFLNGELNCQEMQFQLKEFHAKGMPGIILHARYGLEMPYIGEKYLDRVRFAVEEARKLGLQTWIYDEMNWPSGTADKRVLQARPDLAQRYIECLNFTVRGPWFTYLTGADSRYIDFERSKPVAAFALGLEGERAVQVIDLTPNLSFVNVIPWEAPPGLWRLMYIVEKEADYYIDALNPEATREFLRLGYEPYAETLEGHLGSQVPGFYTDEPAMHYYVTGADNPILPWTKGMFQRFQQRNGYNLHPRLPDLFFDINDDSAKVRYDFYTTITEFYSQAYYRQIYEWCEEHGVLFTGHLLYEEWLRRLIRVEGNLYKHYPYMHVIGVDHLYPFIGSRDRPDEHVAMKVGSSAAHQMRSPRLLCESFGGIFMDATMQRMKWIADWEYVLGVNLLNPHGFHYTLEGPRKRDWPPSQFYQYPWWQYYGAFSQYISRLSHLLSGGHHVASAAVLWPLNPLFASYTPQSVNPLGERTLHDFNALADLLLRVHYDYDFLDEDIFAQAGLDSMGILVADETYPLLVLPPVTHLKIETLERLEQFIARGGRALAAVFLPGAAFGPDGLVDISARVQALFGAAPAETQADFSAQPTPCIVYREHPSGGITAFLQCGALAQGQPDAVQQLLEKALNRLAGPDVVIDNPEIFYLHRVNDGQDVYFFVNSTFTAQSAQVTLRCARPPMLWDPSTGLARPAVPLRRAGEKVSFPITLPAAGSIFVLPGEPGVPVIVDTNLFIDRAAEDEISGYGAQPGGFVTVERGGQRETFSVSTAGEIPAPLQLDGAWEFTPQGDNALVIGRWLAREETDPAQAERYARPDIDTSSGWLEMKPGAWSYQLPSEPSTPYPIAVWYRAPFHVLDLPQDLALVIDGFAGSAWQLYINGQPVEDTPIRSKIDSQMQSVDITRCARPGANLIALRLVLREPTDGLLDLLKLVGRFRVLPGAGGEPAIAAPSSAIRPADWTAQGYPFYSGAGSYRTRFTLPQAYAGKRVFLRAQAHEDALEVLVNGKSAGVRLWPPYEVEITALLQPGENVLELRAANTLINLLEAERKPSGLSGTPDLAAYYSFSFKT